MLGRPQQTPPPRAGRLAIGPFGPVSTNPAEEEPSLPPHQTFLAQAYSYDQVQSNPSMGFSLFCHDDRETGRQDEKGQLMFVVRNKPSEQAAITAGPTTQGINASTLLSLPRLNRLLARRDNRKPCGDACTCGVDHGCAAGIMRRYMFYGVQVTAEPRFNGLTPRFAQMEFTVHYRVHTPNIWLGGSSWPRDGDHVWLLLVYGRPCDDYEEKAHLRWMFVPVVTKTKCFTVGKLDDPHNQALPDRTTEVVYIGCINEMFGRQSKADIYRANARNLVGITTQTPQRRNMLEFPQFKDEELPGVTVMIERRC